MKNGFYDFANEGEKCKFFMDVDQKMKISPEYIEEEKQKKYE